MSKNNDVSTRKALEKIVSSFVEKNRQEINQFLDFKNINPDAEYRETLFQGVLNSISRTWGSLVVTGERCSLWKVMLEKIEEAVAVEEVQACEKLAEKRGGSANDSALFTE